MTSACSSTADPALQTDLETLAGTALNPAFFRAEREFRALDTEQKVDRVASFETRIFQLETTTRCNLRCPLCSTHHLKRGYVELGLDMVSGIVRDNPRIAYACLHLMGEPLLSPALFPIVRCLNQAGVYTYFSTNGLLLKEKVAAILASGLDKISISLDGITPEDLARYRVPADLDRILSGIRALKAERDARGLARPLIQTQTIMFSYNAKKDGEVVRFLKSLEVDRIKLKRPSFDSFGGRNDPSGAFRDEPEGAGESTYSREDPAYVRYRDRAVCRLLFQGFALSDGTVVPCCIDYDGAAAFGSLKRRSWRHIRESDRRREVLRRYFRGELEICRTCSLGYGYSSAVFDRYSPGPF